MGKFENVTMKLSEAVDIYKGLQEVKDIKGSRFSIVVAKNMKTLIEELKDIDKLATPSDEFMQVSAQVHKLAESEDVEGIQKLEEDHKDLIESRKKQLEEVEKLLEKEVSIPIYKLREDQLPNELNSEQLLPILGIIDNDTV